MWFKGSLGEKFCIMYNSNENCINRFSVGHNGSPDFECHCVGCVEEPHPTQWSADSSFTDLLTMIGCISIARQLLRHQLLLQNALSQWSRSSLPLGIQSVWQDRARVFFFWEDVTTDTTNEKSKTKTRCSGRNVDACLYLPVYRRACFCSVCECTIE